MTNIKYTSYHLAFTYIHAKQADRPTCLSCKETFSIVHYTQRELPKECSSGKALDFSSSTFDHISPPLTMTSIISQNNHLVHETSPPLWTRRQHARLSRSGPGFDPRSGQVSWVRVLSRFFLTCKTNVGKL